MVRNQEVETNQETKNDLLTVPKPKRVQTIYDRYRNLVGARTYEQGVEGFSQTDLESECYILIHDLINQDDDLWLMGDTDQVQYLSAMLRQHVQFLRTKQTRKCRTLSTSNGRVAQFNYDAICDGIDSLSEVDVTLAESLASEPELEFRQTLTEIQSLLDEEEAVLFKMINNPPDRVYEILNTPTWDRFPSRVPHWVWRVVLGELVGKTIQSYRFKEIVERLREVTAACTERLDLVKGVDNLSSCKFGVASA